MINDLFPADKPLEQEGSDDEEAPDFGELFGGKSESPKDQSNSGAAPI